MTDWLPILRQAIADDPRGITGVAERLGYSRPAVSRVLSGTYGDPTRLAAKVLATYARTDTDVLMSQRLRSQQNGVVDIAPEQYQQLRQQFLTTLTLPVLNQELKQQLSREPAMLIAQPKGESELNAAELRAVYDKVMAPVESAPAAGDVPSASASSQ